MHDLKFPSSYYSNVYLPEVCFPLMPLDAVDPTVFTRLMWEKMVLNCFCCFKFLCVFLLRKVFFPCRLFIIWLCV